MARKEVALVIHDGVQALDVAGPLDVFAEANAFVRSDRGYDCVLVGENTATIRASNGTPMSAHTSFADATRPFHTVLVAGGPELPNSSGDEAMSQWLRMSADKAQRYGSICTGAFALGHAGLLDGRVVTTHWQNAARLATMFPQALIQHDRIHTRDERLVTSAGVTAGIDLALALVAEDHGPAVSLQCAKRLVVVAQRQGGQSQFSPLLLAATDPGNPLSKIQAYVMDHIREPFSVERLAKIGGISPRSVARLFVKEQGITPHEYVEGIRIDHARNLLEATDLALKAVSFDCGFASPEQMRAAFQRRLGVSPLRYRASFQVHNNKLDAAGQPAMTLSEQDATVSSARRSRTLNLQ